jgi:predicted GIY-YIG superfamily endonuclease
MWSLGADGGFCRGSIHEVQFMAACERIPSSTAVPGIKPTIAIYALRCPMTNAIHYVGVTRNPKSRRSMHRSRKKNPSTPVDKWTAEWAAAGQPVKWQTIAVISAEFRSIAIATEAAIIAQMKRLGHDLLNVDLDAVRRRKRPPGKIDQELLRRVLQSTPTDLAI